MKTYAQIKLVSPSGKVWISPGIYSLPLAEKKLKSMKWLERLGLIGKEGKRGTLSLIPPPSDFPKKAIWKPEWDKERGSVIDKITRRLEYLWWAWRAEKKELQTAKEVENDRDRS